MPFESADGTVSPVLDEIVQGPAAALTAVALVAGPAARKSGWAARAATTIASRWLGPRRVVLVDLDLERPTLHEQAGVANDEGIADVADYGISLGLVRRDVGTHDLVTAGPYIPDAQAVLESAAWDRVLAEISVERATLLTYVPADAAGVEAVIRRAGAVIVLAEDGEGDSVVERVASPYAVLAVLVPATSAPEATVPEATTPVPEAESPAAADSMAAGVVAGADPDDDEPLAIAAAADLVIFGDHSAGDDATGEDTAGDTSGGDDDGLKIGVARLSDEEFERIRLPKDQASREKLIAELRERQRAARLGEPDDAATGAAGAAGAVSGAGAGAGGAAAAGGAAGAARSGDVAGADAADYAPGRTILVPVGESDHAREMRVEASADDMTLETLEPGERRDVSRGWGPTRTSRFRRPMGWTLSVVLGVSLLAGAWHFLSGRIGADVVGNGAAVTPPVVQSEPATATSVVEDEALPFTVVMEAHTDLAAAFARIDALAAARPLEFHIVPLEREGTLFYHIMAGPVADSASAVTLRDTLMARRLKTSETPTDVRHTPLAFLIGDFGTRDVANQSMNELRRLDVPAYMLHADALDGEPLYRVYVGGFSSAAEADVTRQLLRAAGAPDSLVTRTGSIAP